MHFGTYAPRASPEEVSKGELPVPSAEFYLKQAEIASRMALIESDPGKAQAMHLLALDYFDKAYRAQLQEMPPLIDPTMPNAIKEQ